MAPQMLVGKSNGKPLNEVTWEDTGLSSPSHRTHDTDPTTCPACGNPNAHAMGVDIHWVYFCPAAHVVFSNEGLLTIMSQ